MRRRRAAWLIWLLAAMTLYFFENNLGTRTVLIASLALPLLSMSCVLRRTWACSLQAPGRTRPGEAAACRCALSGGGSRFCRAVFRLHGRNLLTGESASAQLPAQPDGTAVLRLNSRHCGRIELTLEYAEVSDWFGLLRRQIPADCAASVLVLPADRLPLDPEREGGAAAGPDRRREGEDCGEIRDYVPGDPVRRIHWKLSAKADRLLLREAAQEGGDVILLLETAVFGEEEAEALDCAARGLLALSRLLAERGHPHAVAWVDFRTGELQRADAADAPEHRMMAERLLSSASGRGEGVLAAFCRAHPEEADRPIILFSPHPLEGLMPGVVLALPEAAPGAGADGKGTVRFALEAERSSL